MDRPPNVTNRTGTSSPETSIGIPPMDETEIHSAVSISTSLPMANIAATKPSPSHPPKIRANSLRRSKTGIVIEPAQEPTRTWPEQIRLWIKSAAGLAYVLSLLTHLSLLVVLAIWLIPQIVGDEGFSINAATSDDADGKTDEIVETQFELPEIEAAIEAPQVVLPLDSASTLTENEIASDISARIQASISGEMGGEDISVALGEPGKNAVVKGSFTAWTVPEDPEPGEDYKIFIRVKLPDRIKDDYPLRDLSGLVIGTDGYRQMIPGPRKSRYVRVKKGYAQFDVKVPGAFRLVKDKIVVRSRMLEEEQLLEIVF